MAEVYAGFVTYTDHQIGRLLDYLEASDQLENTIVLVVSDNGASGEGGPNGSFNENKFLNGLPDTVAENLKHLDDLGSPSSYNHYNTGWAWAFDTPFPYWKRFAGYEGGTADLCLRLVAEGHCRTWGGTRSVLARYRPGADDLRAARASSRPRCSRDIPRARSRVRASSHHSPILALQGVGRSSTRCSVCGRSTTMAGWRIRSIRRSRAGAISTRTSGSSTTCARTVLRRATSRSINPTLLERLKGLWWYNAGLYKGLPLDDRMALEIMSSPRPQPSPPRARYVYLPG